MPFAHAAAPPAPRCLPARAGFALAALLALAGCSPPFKPALAPESLPPAPAGTEHASSLFQAPTGGLLYEQVWRPRAGAKAVVVLVHGLKDHSDRYGRFADRLAAEGFEVRAFDLRGHGHSEGIRVDTDSFDTYLLDLGQVLGRAREANPDKPVFLFGHSMGGAIATLYVMDRKPKLAGLVLSGAALEVDVSFLKVAGTRFIAWLSPRAGVFQLDLADLSRDPGVVKASASDPLVYQGGAPAHTATELLDAIDRIGKSMEEVSVPLLVLHGGADKVIPPHGSQELQRRARSPDKTIHLYPGLYHDLLHEPEKEQVMSDIIAWLNARAPSPPPLAPPPLAPPPLAPSPLPPAKPAPATTSP